MQAEQVTDKSGNPVLVQTENGDMVPAYGFNAAGANKALELLGRNLGMFTDKTEIDANLFISEIRRTVVDPKE